jgi:flagellar biosynthesis/type III secretory pathway M-ring protein FliF/YscJ
MSGLIIAIVVIVILAVIVFAVAMPRARAKARERELVRRRDEVAGAHRSEAEDRVARAELAEQQAARERAEAELHQTRASTHERGLADDELEQDRERLGVDGESDRFEREPARDDETVRREERR